MNPNIRETWAQVQKDLVQKVLEAERIGDRLIELGKHLQQEPWRLAIGWLDASFPEADLGHLLEPEIEAALDRQHLVWLLDDIRILRRREHELRKLIASLEAPRLSLAR